MQSRNLKKRKKTEDIYVKMVRLGLLLVALAFFGALIIFFPVIKKEISYRFNKPDENIDVASSELDSMRFFGQDNVIVAEDPLFSIVVPKIGANSKVIPDVDPYNSKVYQVALTKGVAHAKGTAYPGERGNSFLFAHSSDNFYNANRYNSVFYLLNKIEIGDIFYLIYQNQIFRYKVTETSVVKADAVEYMSESNEKIATLMTCWPAGTTINRLVVVGKLVE
ncbi:sortase [Patescibacteria group bacterium]|nr:sortase [Patescibacteria group bacterium]